MIAGTEVLRRTVTRMAATRAITDDPRARGRAIAGLTAVNIQAAAATATRITNSVAVLAITSFIVMRAAGRDGPGYPPGG